MEFRKATKNEALPSAPIDVAFHCAAYPLQIDVSNSQFHSDDKAIKNKLRKAGYSVDYIYPYRYAVSGGTREDLEMLTAQIEVAYGIR